MMKQTLIASAVASAFLMVAVPAMAEDAPAAAAPPPPYTLTGNISVVSDYLFRGISQTHGRPALQGGFDFTHSSGLYVGTWLSSISWVSDFLGGSTPTELDLYGGYRGTFADDFGYDVGVITYNYPGHAKAIPTILANPNTTEVYGALSYKWLSAKYSYTASSHFVGWYGGANYDEDTKGSGYLELNAAYDLGGGWGVNGHVGHQKVENSVSTAGAHDASYTDYNIGVTKDVGFGVVGLKYSDTDTDGSCSSTQLSAYCWPGSGGGHAKNVSDDTVVLSFTKTF
jgi:uncharacterized protein (TIGR02001 family)